MPLWLGRSTVQPEPFSSDTGLQPMSSAGAARLLGQEAVGQRAEVWSMQGSLLGPLTLCVYSSLSRHGAFLNKMSDGSKGEKQTPSPFFP